MNNRYNKSITSKLESRESNEKDRLVKQLLNNKNYYQALF